MESFAQPNHYYGMFMRHRDRCVFCRGENFIRSSALLCTYGKWLCDMYNKLFQREWELDFFAGPPAGFDKILEYRSRPEYWVGCLWSRVLKSITACLWNYKKRTSWARRLVERMGSYVGNRLHRSTNTDLRDLSGEELAIQPRSDDDSDHQDYWFGGGIRTPSRDEMGGAGIHSLQTWDEVGWPESGDEQGVARS